MEERKKQRGVVLVEMVIVLPLVLLVLSGIVEYGNLIRELQAAAGAARYGARAAASNTTLSTCGGASPPDLCSGSTSVVCLARVKAEEYLSASSVDPKEWRVTSYFAWSKVPSWKNQTLVMTVQIQRSPGGRRGAVYRILGLFSSYNYLKASFAVEGPCNGYVKEP